MKVFLVGGTGLLGSEASRILIERVKNKVMIVLYTAKPGAVIGREGANKTAIVEKLQKLYKDDKDELEKYTKILYAQARLIEGLPIDNPTEISNLVCELISK